VPQLHPIRKEKIDVNIIRSMTSFVLRIVFQILPPEFGTEPLDQRQIACTHIFDNVVLSDQKTTQ
jgi:hypothetical protein